MDIAITLPKEFWEKIVSGEKSYELRKNFPKKYRIGIDRVYVILKGTKKVVGYFKVITSFEEAQSKDAILLRNRIGVDAGWILEYLDYGRLPCYLWSIGDTTVLFNPWRSDVDLHLKSNPQSFCYIK